MMTENRTRKKGTEIQIYLEEGNSYWIGDGLKRVVEFGDI